VFFLKYHSLQNDFILINAQNIDPEMVKKLCNRHTGIGADGILLLDGLRAKIFNSDGSDGGLCLNGARCIAHYLYAQKNFPKEFEFKMGDKIIRSKILDKNRNIQIQNQIDLGQYFGKKNLKTRFGEILGYLVDVGNPHFITTKKINSEELIKLGCEISHHKEFPNQTNVEFIWPNSDTSYGVLVYERGCGPTKACSSGAAAIITFLAKEKGLEAGVKITLQMPGGNLNGWWLNEKSPKIVLEASAEFVFSGKLNLSTIKTHSTRSQSSLAQGDRFNIIRSP